MYPYFENPQAWMPKIEVGPDGVLLRLSSFFLVIAPQEQSEMKTYEDYKNLLRHRVSWMIRQWTEDQLMSLEEVYHMIRQHLLKEQVQDFPHPRDEEETPETWAAALVDSPLIESYWTLEVGLNFPVPMESDLENQRWIVEAIPAHTLEEWLIQFTKQENSW